MSRADQLIRIADETVSLVRAGSYQSPSGRRVDIAEDVGRCLDRTRLITPPELERLLATAPPATNPDTPIAVTDKTTLAAARRLVVDEGKERVIALNFASAVSPGGYFLAGTATQEDALAYASALYESQLTQPAYYHENRGFGSELYTDHMILSPDVPVFRDDSYQLLESPYRVGMLTAPAVNAFGVGPHEQDQIGPTMARRTRMVIRLLADEACEHLVLGAWGCGAFGNDPEEIARLFADALAWCGPFRELVFAIPDFPGDRPNVQAFERVFG